MKIVAFYIMFVILIIALYGVAFSMNPAEQPDGKKVFTDNKCSTCHSIDSEGIVRKAKTDKNSPADLSQIGSTFTKEKLTNYLTKKESLNDKKHPANFKGSEDELNAMVKWLMTHKKGAPVKTKK